MNIEMSSVKENRVFQRLWMAIAGMLAVFACVMFAQISLMAQPEIPRPNSETEWLTDETSGLQYYTVECGQNGFYYSENRVYLVENRLLAVIPYENSWCLIALDDYKAKTTKLVLPSELEIYTAYSRIFENSNITELSLDAYKHFVSLFSGTFETSKLKKLTYRGYDATVSTESSFYYLTAYSSSYGLSDDVFIYANRTNGRFYTHGFTCVVQEGELKCKNASDTAKGTIVLPSDFTISSVATWAFEGKNITGIKLPNTVTTIGTGAFSNTKLTSITIPKSVTTMGYDVFDGCKALKTITFKKYRKTIFDNTEFLGVNPANVTFTSTIAIRYSGGFHFWDYKGVLVKVRNERNAKNLKIPSTIRHIERGITYDGNIETITIPNSVTIIDDWAFMSCTKLKKVTMPANLSSIGYGVFSECSQLKTIVLPRLTEIYETPGWMGGSKATVVVKKGSLDKAYAYRISGYASITKTTAVAMNETKLTMLVGDTENLWLLNTLMYCKGMKSSNKSVVSVDSQGMLVAKKAGKATISIKYKNKTYKCSVTVLSSTLENRVKQLDKQYNLTSLSDYHIARAVFLWMCYRCCYDYSFSEYWEEGILLKHTGVCNSYMVSTNYVLSYFNIPSECCVSNSMNHGWNYVKIGKNWYHTDATWGNFLLTDKQIQSPESGQGSGLPKAGHYDYEKKHKCNSSKIDKNYRSKR